MHSKLIDMLCCPKCRSGLQLHDEVMANNEVKSGTLECVACSSQFHIKEFVPILVSSKFEETKDEDWLGPEPRSVLGPRIWFLCSNFIGLIFLPLLAIFGWCLDIVTLLFKKSPPFAIRDVRGFMLWHLRFLRPYQHLRMLEHALAIRMVREMPDADNVYIIDIGAEKSLFASYLAKRGYRVVVFDLDQAQVFWQERLSRKYGTDVTARMDFMVGSATEVPFKDGSAAVTAISVIEHIEEDDEVFREIGRVVGDSKQSIISFLYQETPLSEGQAAAAWKRAREHHPAYGEPRDIGEHILTPSNCEIRDETFFWKKLCRRAKSIVRATRIFNQSIIFDYFVYVRLCRLEEVLYPGKQANFFAKRKQAFQWIFRLGKKSAGR